MTVWHEALPQDNLTLVGVRGRLDQSLTAELDHELTALMDDGHVDLLIDLSETTYINSGGLRSLVSAWRRARRDGGSIVLCGLNERLLEIFEMVGFDKVFEIEPDCDEARAPARQ